MSKYIDYIDSNLYGRYGDNWDDTIFRDNILKNIKSSYTCLDLGAGRGNLPHMNFRNKVAFMAGIDIDDAIQQNPYLDEAKVISQDNYKIPYPDNTFDLIFACNVMEHVEDPSIVLSEVNRVLKHSGVFMFKTTNKWHYVALVARITPSSFHVYYNKMRGREEMDTFPTQYKFNSKKDIVDQSLASGLEVQSINVIEGRPEYLRINPILYILGAIFERVVNLTPIFENLRCVIVATLAKRVDNNID